MEWKAALYGRVSTDHDEQQESIRVQRESLIEYARENGYGVVNQYFDEGFSGTNFTRPGMELLKKDIEDGRINLILVKDLSRIGRNNPLTLLFLDYLAENGARLIAVNDNYDTLKDDDDLIGIKTWFNERYSRELSKKIKFALKHKKRMGEYLTAYAPYGYKKSEIYRNKLEKDYYAANVIKEIYDMYIGGYGFQKIASMLQERGTPNPSSYGRYSKKSDRWDWSMVRKIITSPVYTGCSLQQCYYKKSFKSKSATKAPHSSWIRVENTHEAIIDKETYDLAQNILCKRQSKYKYRCGPQKPHLYTSFLFCHECGSPLYYKEDKDRRGLYRCGKYVRYGIRGCSSHHIYENELTQIVVTKLYEAVNNLLDKETFINDIMMQLNADNNFSGRMNFLEKQIEKALCKKEILYKDRLDGIIDDRLFIKNVNELDNTINGLQAQVDNIKQAMESFNNNGCRKLIEKCMGFSDGLDREILERLINKIEICENSDILIYYNFTDKFD